MIDKLREKNNIKIYTIHDEEFKKFGKVISKYDFSEMIKYMEDNTVIPGTGNIYLADDEKLKQCNPVELIKDEVYGGMDIQAGYCNGRNSFLNGLEYHKCSEVNVAVTDLVLLLADLRDEKNGKIDVSDISAFYIKKGEAIELFQTTLHFAPCKVSDEGFKCIVILTEGTNTELKSKEDNSLLFKKNKWLYAHPENKRLMDQKAYPGINGQNLEIKY